MVNKLQLLVRALLVVFFFRSVFVSCTAKRLFLQLWLSNFFLYSHIAGEKIQPEDHTNVRQGAPTELITCQIAVGLREAPLSLMSGTDRVIL